MTIKQEADLMKTLLTTISTPDDFEDACDFARDLRKQPVCQVKGCTRRATWILLNSNDVEWLMCDEHTSGYKSAMTKKERLT